MTRGPAERSLTGASLERNSWSAGPGTANLSVSSAEKADVPLWHGQLPRVPPTPVTRRRAPARRAVLRPAPPAPSYQARPPQDSRSVLRTSRRFAATRFWPPVALVDWWLAATVARSDLSQRCPRAGGPALRGCDSSVGTARYARALPVTDPGRVRMKCSVGGRARRGRPLPFGDGRGADETRGSGSASVQEIRTRRVI